MKTLLAAFCLLSCCTASTQELFSYGKQVVTTNNFIQAFKKNNQGAITEKTLADYLELYIASRLKIQEAREKGFDTLPQLLADLANLREQILPAYITDKESMDNLVNEAFARSKKDIHLAHIFISHTAGEAQATAKKDQVLKALNSNKDFGSVAAEFSDDPAAKSNKGDLGWVTVFSLPYNLETLAYQTPTGNLSSAFRSKAGYHIFKNLGERKAMGRIKVAQILMAFPPGSTEAEKKKIQKTADSLYARIKAGSDFGKLAAAFSNDVVSAANNGHLPEFGVGEYELNFENTAFALKNDGDVSRPVVTQHGIHIIKRLSLQSLPEKLTETEKENWKKKTEQSDRIASINTRLVMKVKEKAGFKKMPFPENSLWAFSDSALQISNAGKALDMNAETPLIAIGNSTTNAFDWLRFMQANRLKSDGSVKPYGQLWSEFEDHAALEYYKAHLEDFNEEFKRQVTEFAEGNLFFEIMQRQVWTPAQTNSTALQELYKENKQQYLWKESADAIIFYAADEKSGKNFYTALQKDPANWKKLLSAHEQITADSNRFELEQLPAAENIKWQKGTLTKPVINNADNTSSFTYVLSLYKANEPRSFNDARGLLINDYQAQLEKKWLSQLQNKYPVAINKKEWKALVEKETR